MIEIKRAEPRLSALGKAFTKKLNALAGDDEEYRVNITIASMTEKVSTGDTKEKHDRRFFRIVMFISVKTSELEAPLSIDIQSLDIIGVPVHIRQEEFLDSTMLTMWEAFKEKMMKVGLSQTVYTRQVEAIQPNELNENNDDSKA